MKYEQEIYKRYRLTRESIGNYGEDLVKCRPTNRDMAKYLGDSILSIYSYMIVDVVESGWRRELLPLSVRGINTNIKASTLCFNRVDVDEEMHVIGVMCICHEGLIINPFVDNNESEYPPLIRVGENVNPAYTLSVTDHPELYVPYDDRVFNQEMNNE